MVLGQPAAEALVWTSGGGSVKKEKDLVLCLFGPRPQLFGLEVSGPGMGLLTGT